MLKLLNYFLDGLLYILISPFLFIIYSFKLAYTIIVYIGGEIIALFSFINGKKYKNVDELSKKLEIVMEQNHNLAIPQPFNNLEFNYAAFAKPKTAVGEEQASQNISQEKSNQRTTVTVTPLHIEEIQQSKRGEQE